MNNYDILKDLERNRNILKMRIDELLNMYEEDGELNEGLDRVWIMSEIKYLKDQVMMMEIFIKKELMRRDGIGA